MKVAAERADNVLSTMTRLIGGAKEEFLVKMNTE